MIKKPASAKLWPVELAIGSQRAACPHACPKTDLNARGFHAYLVYAKANGLPEPTWAETQELFTRNSGTDFTKLNALKDDLASLRKTEPDLHAVVFTQQPLMYKRVVAMLQGAGYVTLGFCSADAVQARHKAIRDFQASVEKRDPDVAKVFVVTTKIGNVGITLTAASRVYLLEPMLDPRDEMQAAGRIHRLGQTKDVMVASRRPRAVSPGHACALRVRSTTEAASAAPCACCRSSGSSSRTRSRRRCSSCTRSSRTARPPSSTAPSPSTPSSSSPEWQAKHPIEPGREERAAARGCVRRDGNRRQ